MPHTAPGDAPALAERIRVAVEERPFLGAEVPPVQVTVSLGTAGTEQHPASAESLLARADAACYEAKRRGRNRVAVAPDPGA